MIESIKINWEILGAQFASLSEEEQGLFFAGLARELKNWECTSQKQAQGSMISDTLRDDEKKELKVFLEMLWYKE